MADKTSRVLNSSRNLAFSLIMQIIKLLFLFVCRTVFIRYIGIAYLGLDSVFSNILTILSLSEIGLGTAIIYNMYKPIASDDKEKIKSLVRLYRIIYNYTAVIILVLGLALIPFLHKIAELPANVNVNMYILYVMFLINTTIGYLSAYKRSLISGYQMNYIESANKTIFIIGLSILQIISIIFFQNYYVYVALMIFATLFENITITLIANKKFPFIKEKAEPLLKEEKKGIFKNTLYLFVNKFAGTIIIGTSTVLLSVFFGLIVAGKYSNYLFVITGLSTFIGFFLVAITASVGNLLAVSDKEKSYLVYKKLSFIFNLANGFTSVCLLVLINKFISIWAGVENTLGFDLAIMCAVNYYLTNNRNFIRVFKQAAGLFKNAWWVYVAEAVLNLAISVLLLKYVGVVGIVLGAVISFVLSSFIAEPIVVFKHCFNENPIKYYIDYFLFGALAVVIYVVSAFVVSKILLTGMVGFAVETLVTVAVALALYIIVFFKNENFRYYCSLAKSMLKKMCCKLLKRS